MRIKSGRIAFILLWIILFLCLNHTGISSQSPLKILITNDDGIDSPGLAVLIDRLTQVGKVTVAAPSKNQSGVGHGLTYNAPILITEIYRKGIPCYSIDALPATCVRLALASLVSEKPDIVVSGINRGSNTGLDTFMSGTVACAREAAFHGLPSVAISMQRGEVMDYPSAADFIAELVMEMNEKGLQQAFFLNVNYPALHKDQVKGVMVTVQDMRPPQETYERRKNPGGRTYFWSLFTPLDQGTADKTDVWALENGFISITPMHIDQTDANALETLKSWKTIKRNE